MHFTENLKQALLSLSTNKLRSILTMLGIIMGVFSVVAIMAISNATKTFMTNELNKMGASTIIIQMNTNEDLSMSDLLSMEDMGRMKDGVDDIEYIAASQTFYTYIHAGDEVRDSINVGATSQFTSFQEINMETGRFISAADVEGARRVVIVPDTYAKEYFGTTDILGEELRINNYYGDVLKVRVIGVYDTDDDLFASLLEGIEMPVQVMMPLTTLQNFFGDETLSSIQVSARQGADLKTTGEKIINLLEFTHRNEDKYIATTVEEIQKSVGGILNVISSVLLVIAIITLVVGGIGIINILLVSVTERIREIGLRKALGAKKRDIVLQFLTESMLMTGFSGVIGIVLGLIVGAIISNVIKIPPIVDVVTMVSALLGSLVLGLIFGVYPAKKAADLDPIESLRYE